MPGRSSNDIINEVFETTMDKVLWYNSDSKLICIELRPESTTLEVYTTMSAHASATRSWIRDAAVTDFTIDTTKTKHYYALKKSNDVGFSGP